MARTRGKVGTTVARPVRGLSIPFEEPTLSDELMFGRPRELKIFVSSKMRGGDLDEERREAITTIDGLGNYKAWAWERDAAADPFFPRNFPARIGNPAPDHPTAAALGWG